MSKEITLKFDERSKFGRLLLQMIKLGVDEKKIKVLPTSPRYNAATEKAIKDARTGKVHKVKNSAQLFKELGI